MVPSELIRLQSQIARELHLSEWIEVLDKLTKGPLAFDKALQEHVNNLHYETEKAMGSLSELPEARALLHHWGLDSAFSRESLTRTNTFVQANPNNTVGLLHNHEVFRHYVQFMGKLEAVAKSFGVMSRILGHADSNPKAGSVGIDLWILDDNAHTLAPIRLSHILNEIEKIQTYCVAIFGGQNEPIAILFTESGSLTKLRVEVFAAAGGFLVGIFTIYFTYLRHDKEIGIQQRSNAILAEISVEQKIQELSKSGEINNDTAAQLQRKLIKSIETLIESGGYLEVPKFTPEEQRQLLLPRRDMLKLNPAPSVLQSETVLMPE